MFCFVHVDSFVIVIFFLVELYQNSPHYFLNHGQDMEVESNLRKDIVDECYPEESRRGSRRRSGFLFVFSLKFYIFE